MAKRKTDDAKELIQSYKDFAEGSSIPYYWLERGQHLARLWTIWRVKSRPYRRRDGLSFIFQGQFVIISIGVISWLLLRDGEVVQAIGLMIIFGGLGTLSLIRGISLLIKPEAEE
jgi:hypothetical protein